MTTRRGFLGAMLAAAAAPAIIKAEALMPVRKIIAPSPEIWTPKPYRSQGGLKTGDIITMEGVVGSFVVTGVTAGVIDLSPIADARFPFPFAREITGVLHG